MARRMCHSGAFLLYVRWSQVLGSGTTPMFRNRLSFAIRADAIEPATCPSERRNSPRWTEATIRSKTRWRWRLRLTSVALQIPGLVRNVRLHAQAGEKNPHRQAKVAVEGERGQ